VASVLEPPRDLTNRSKINRKFQRTRHHAQQAAAPSDAEAVVSQAAFRGSRPARDIMASALESPGDLKGRSKDVPEFARERHHAQHADAHQYAEAVVVPGGFQRLQAGAWHYGVGFGIAR
jgi:hypothetical protein